MKRLAYRLLSFQTFLVSGLVVVTLLTVRNRFADPDIWWHPKVGQEIVETQVIPSTDQSPDLLLVRGSEARLEPRLRSPR